jgi:hypothetical protein
MFEDVELVHVLHAVEFIQRYGVPAGRESRTHHVRFGGTTYPPKYLIELAAAYARGVSPNPIVDYHTDDAVARLRELGFQVVEFPAA